MSADLVLLALPDTEESRKAVETWNRVSYIEFNSEGPDYSVAYDEDDVALGRYDDLLEALYKQEQRWVGQVSWMKAGLLDDFDRYVPAPVARISALVGEGKVLTPGLAKEITVAMNRPNRSIYERKQGYRALVKPRKLKKWLAEHTGDYIFQISE